jgi:hypothetical protein
VANAPITSSSQAVAKLQQQLADVFASKTEALTEMTTCLTTGLRASYTITGKVGSETVGATQYLDHLKNRIAEFTKLEQSIIQMIQDLQPYQLSIRYSV